MGVHVNASDHNRFLFRSLNTLIRQLSYINKKLPFQKFFVDITALVTALRSPKKASR
jgi:hypothetical protein